MAHYAVGDLQGCYRELMALLERVGFNPKNDKLWVVGDMVSRGPDSDKTLRFLFKHRESVYAVLGNHDLHLIAIYLGVKRARASDNLEKALKAKARHDWVDWLRTLPLCFYHEEMDVAMVHAGIAPQWTLQRALIYSAEVEALLQSDYVDEFVAGMYGDAPAKWHAGLGGMQRLRCITNYFTRMRVLHRSGEMDFSYKGDLQGIKAGFYPWFRHPARRTKNNSILFGHWAALGGYFEADRLYGLDTGCVWGRHMTLMDLETMDFYMVESMS